MAKPRIPLAKAEVTGAKLRHAGRFADRTDHKGARYLGEPYATMTVGQKAAWKEFEVNCPWLRAHHRQLVRMASVLSARFEDGDTVGITAISALSSILSKLGATPVDESKVNFQGEPPPQDPSNKFFQRTH